MAALFQVLELILYGTPIVKSAHAAKDDVISTLFTLGSLFATFSSCKLDLTVSSIIHTLTMWVHIHIYSDMGDAINILQNSIEGIRSINVRHLNKFKFGADMPPSRYCGRWSGQYQRTW